jgi:hypothetical protein
VNKERKMQILHDRSLIADFATSLRGTFTVRRAGTVTAIANNSFTGYILISLSAGVEF